MHGETESPLGKASFAPGPHWGQNSLDLDTAGLPGIPGAHDAESRQINPAGERRYRLGLGTLDEGCAFLGVPERRDGVKQC